MAESNYGVILKKGSTTIGALTNIDFPKVSTEAVEITNHAGGGVREHIPSGLLNFENFTATILASESAYSAIKTDIDAGTYSSYTIDYTTASGLTDWVFSCYPVSIEISSADATSPDKLEMVIEFNISGDVTGF